MRRVFIVLSIAAGMLFALASGTEPEQDGGLSRADAGTAFDAASPQQDAAGGYDTYAPGYDAYSPGYDAATPGYDAATPSYDASMSGTCTLNDLFFDSPNVCQAGFFCNVDPSYQPVCVPDSAAAGGTFYGACGANGECPVGSMCAGPTIAEATCAPFCSETHQNCPDNGTCAFVVTGAEHIRLCGASDSCDPVDNTGCTEGGCYVAGEDSVMCLSPVGTMTEGQTCQFTNDCTPGLLCVGDCRRMCHLGTDADCNGGETCQAVTGLNTYGICAS